MVDYKNQDDELSAIDVELGAVWDTIRQIEERLLHHSKNLEKINENINQVGAILGELKTTQTNEVQVASRREREKQ